MDQQDSDKIFRVLCESEANADLVLSISSELLELDKRRQGNREAHRALSTQNNPHEQSVWITVGSMLVKMKRENALRLLVRENEIIEREVRILHDRQKSGVQSLAKAERSTTNEGFNLKPLSRAEMHAFKSNFRM